jgi:hypothetical protein
MSSLDTPRLPCSIARMSGVAPYCATAGNGLKVSTAAADAVLQVPRGKGGVNSRKVRSKNKCNGRFRQSGLRVQWCAVHNSGIDWPHTVLDLLMSAPLSSRHLTASSFPALEAACRGVSLRGIAFQRCAASLLQSGARSQGNRAHPALFLASNLAPLPSREVIAAICSPAAAMCRGVFSCCAWARHGPVMPRTLQCLAGAPQLHWHQRTALCLYSTEISRILQAILGKIWEKCRPLTGTHVVSRIRGHARLYQEVNSLQHFAFRRGPITGRLERYVQQRFSTLQGRRGITLAAGICTPCDSHGSARRRRGQSQLLLVADTPVV